MKNRYYIAYGSNLNIRQMRFRCPRARIVGTAEIDGYELLFKGSCSGSYLTIEQKADSKVPVAVWAVTAADEAVLDRYEGFPKFYYKKDFTLDVRDIKTGKTRSLETFVYIMHEERKIGVPSKFYVATCIEGYKAFGFETTPLFTALNHARRYCSEEE